MRKHKQVGCCYSVYNKTLKHWATTTNFSTMAEATALKLHIEKHVKVCSYEVRPRPFGTMKEPAYVA